MNNDRELMQQALDALESLQAWPETPENFKRFRAIEALRARLAQPENDFNPDWDAMAVMVEEQQRMAKRIEELEARLAQPEQEPVGINKVIIDSIRDSSEIVAPPKREWVGLTDKEILADDVLRYHFGMNGGAGPVSKKGKTIIEAIEAKLKEKNT